MSFAKNDVHQVTLNNTLWGLTKREKRMLERSWATQFADNIFPLIDEERFAVLYSDKASRPNTPVNVIIGALILKELRNQTDDEIFESLLFDVRYQRALHTENFDEQPMSDTTLKRFRKRCLTYETEHDVDLVHECITELSGEMAKLMNISGQTGKVCPKYGDSIRKSQKKSAIMARISTISEQYPIFELYEVAKELMVAFI